MDRGGGIKLPALTNFNGTLCTYFDGNSRLKLKNTDLLKPLTEWTVCANIYPTEVIGSYYGSQIFSNIDAGSSSSDVNLILLSGTTGKFCGTEFEFPYSIFKAWHRVKITSDGTTIYLYLDGREIKNILRGSIGFNQTGFSVGGANGHADYDANFYGYMMDFRLTDEYNAGNKFIYINKNNEVWAMV